MNTSKPYFTSIEIGELPCPRGCLKFVTVKSPSLRQRADVTLYVPEQALAAKRDLPVILLLHGINGSHWAWAFSGKAHLTLQAMIDTGEVPPMILAMPSDGLWSDGSGYLPHDGHDFERWIARDVPQLVSEVSGNPLDVPHFIGGLSMGGFGAMRIGAKYPERFRAFSGHSSSTTLSRLRQVIEQPIEIEAPATEVDTTVLQTILAYRETLPPFRFDCGSEDFLIDYNRELHAALKDAGIEHSYEEFPGAHEWSYWETHVSRSFRFFAQQLVDF